MKKTINFKDLEALLDNSETVADALNDYFYFDNHKPFSGQYKLKPDIQVIESPTNVSISERESNPNLLVISTSDTTQIRSLKDGLVKKATKKANKAARRKRDKKYEQTKSDSLRIKVVSEGDSWFQYPKFKLVVTIKKEVKDIIDYLIDDDHYAIKSLGAGGDLLRDMYHSREYINVIKHEQPQIFLLSAGGNDFFEVFSQMLKEDYENASASELLDVNFQTEVEIIGKYLRELLTELLIVFPNIQIVLHGYDYLRPRKDGRWIGIPLEKKIFSPTKRKAVIKQVIDIFNTALETLSNEAQFRSNVHYLDLRGTVDDESWHDEIHPNDDGYKLIADKFKAKIQEIVPLVAFSKSRTTS